MPQVFGENLSRMMRQRKLFGEEDDQFSTQPTPQLQQPNFDFGREQNRQMFEPEQLQIPTRNMNIRTGPEIGTSRFEDDSEITDIWNQYTPETEATDYFNKLMQDYPEKESPSKWRRAGAAILGFAHGPKVQDEYLNQPYYEGLDEWKAKITPAQQAMSQERQRNVNERQLLSGMVNAKLSAGKAAQAQDLKISELQTRADIAAATAARLAEESKRDQGNYELRMKFEEAKHAAQLAEQAADNARQWSEYELRKRNTESLIEERNEPGGGGGNNELEQARSRTRRAAEWLEAHPGMERYVAITDPVRGIVDIKPPSGPSGWLRNEPEKWSAQNQAEAYKEIYGKDLPSQPAPVDRRPASVSGVEPTANPGNPNVPSMTPAPARPAQAPVQARPPGVPAGYIRVIQKSDGKSGWIPPEDFDAAIYTKR